MGNRQLLSMVYIGGVMKVLIADTGPFCRDVCESIEECGIEVDGYIEFYDAHRCKTEADRLKKPIIWWKDVAQYAGTHALVHGKSEIERENHVSRMELLGMNYATFVHSKAHVCKSVKLGKGCYVAAGCVIGTDSVVGNHVMFHRGCIIGHDVVLGDYSSVAPTAICAGGSSVGRGTFVGIGANIVDGKSVGDYCIVGAGAVITKHWGNNLKLMGVPAKVVKTKIRGR